MYRMDMDLFYLIPAFIVVPEFSTFIPILR